MTDNLFKVGDIVKVKEDANLAAENFAHRITGFGFLLEQGMVGKIVSIDNKLDIARIEVDGESTSVYVNSLEHYKEDEEPIDGVTIEITFDGENLEITSDFGIDYPTQYTHALGNIVAALYDLLGVGFND